MDLDVSWQTNQQCKLIQRESDEMKFINLEDRMTGKLVLVELKSIAMITQATERDLHLTDYEAKMNKGYLEQFDDTIEFSLIATTAGVIHVKEDIHLVAAKIIAATR